MSDDIGFDTMTDQDGHEFVLVPAELWPSLWRTMEKGMYLETAEGMREIQDHPEMLDGMTEADLENVYQILTRARGRKLS